MAAMTIDRACVRQAARAMRPTPKQEPPTFVLDKDALLEVFDSSDGRRWAYSKGWSDRDSDPCKDRWSGVTCDAASGRVIALCVCATPACVSVSVWRG